LLWSDELWLYSGAVTVLAGFALWVGATGAALRYGADFAGVELSVVEWSSLTTIVLGVVTVLWLLAPAALVTYLVHGRLTNVSGNVHTHYRVQHPSLLVVPVLVLFAIGVGAAVGLGETPTALAGALALVALLAVIRTVAYSYRVFSFSVPLLVYAGLFVSLVVVAVTLLVAAGQAAGRRAFVEAAAGGVGDLLGTSAVEDVLLGSTTAGPLTVSTLLGLTAGLPVGVAAVYIPVQSAFGLVARVRKPDVPRSKLRTGQRYPAFARPISEQAAGGRSANTSASGSTPADTAEAADGGPDASTDSVESAGGDAGAASADGADEADDEDGDAPIDEASHTRVYTAPDDADFDGAVPGVDEVPDAMPAESSSEGAAGGETAVTESEAGTDGSDVGGYRCPTCSEAFDADTNFAYCPTCGTELEPET
jgi:rubrerythrin